MNCSKPSNTSTRNSYTPKSHSAPKGGYKPANGNPFSKQGEGNFGKPQVRLSFSGKKR